MIRFENVSKYYRTRNKVHKVLDNISIELPQGEAIGLLGANGTGKSTFVRLACGAEMPTKGRVTKDCRVSWPLALSGGIHSSLTGRQNTHFVIRLFGKDDETKEIIERVTEFADIGKYYDEPVSLYSSGMRSRLSFALSLAIKFDYYLIDEITAVGDELFRKKANDAFEELKKDSGLLFVSHSTRAVRELCSKAFCLRDGSLHYFEKMNDAIKFYREGQ